VESVTKNKRKGWDLQKRKVLSLQNERVRDWWNTDDNRYKCQQHYDRTNDVTSQPSRSVTSRSFIETAERIDLVSGMGA